MFREWLLGDRAAQRSEMGMGNILSANGLMWERYSLFRELQLFRAG
jgi:hypothetical protein